MRFIFLLLICCFNFLGTYSQKYGNNHTSGNYKKVNNIQLYYEEYGSGKPLLLLHGNGGSINAHSARIDFFSKYFHVIAVDSRGHGKSIDTTSELSYEMMASDLNTLLDSLQLDSVFVWGQSDGGILALMLAMKYPNKVSRIAAFAPNLKPDTIAVEPAIVQMVQADALRPKTKKAAQLNRLLLEHPNIEFAELKRIKCPTLIMCGDRDAIRLGHIVSIFKSIQLSNLFVVPGATHFGAYEYPEMVHDICLRFFTGPFRNWSTIGKMKGLY